MKMLEEMNWEPEIEVIRFAAADIVTTSEILDEDELPPWIIT